MQNDKAPERIYLQYHKASERTSIMWTEYPEKNKTQIDIPYIRADLVDAKVKAVQVKLDAEQQYIKSLHRDIRELRKLAGLYEGEEK